MQSVDGRVARTILAGPAATAGMALALLSLIAAVPPWASIRRPPSADEVSASALSASRYDPPQQVSEKEKAIEEGRNALKIPSFERAREAFRLAARLDRRDPLPRVWLGRSYFLERPNPLDRKAHLERALRELDRALELDPTFREARYWKGRVLMRSAGRSNLEEARRLFEGLVAEDLTYEDAIRRLQEIHVELGILPRYLAARKEAAEADPGDPMATYRYAEALRQSGELGLAEALLRQLRESRRDFLPGRVNYSLALTLFDGERYEEGTEFYLDAIAFMQNPVPARMMWEDAYLIANLDEMRRFREAETVEDFRDLFRAFWKSRDPTKTTVENERIGVHYERLTIAWREYQLAGVRAAWNDPDHNKLLRLPPTYDLIAPFDDMGLIFLRHGEPDDRAFLHAANVPDNMSWMYETKGQRAEMILHFEQHPLGGGWRFVPTPGPGEYAISRTSLDAKYGALQYGMDQQAVQRLAQDANIDLREALTRDTHIPEFDVTPLTVYNDEATFKAAGGLTRYEAYWAIPLMELMSDAVAQQRAVDIGVKVSLFTEDYREVYKNERVERVSIPAGTPLDAMTVDQEVMVVRPGSYRLVLQFEESTGNKLQVQEIQVNIREYPEGELDISDIEIALQILEEEHGRFGRFVKSGYTVWPLPTRVYQSGQPAQIYFDIYGLAKDEIGATRYRTSYQLVPGGGERGTLGRISIAGLLGRHQAAGGVTVTGDEETGIHSDVHKVLTIELGDSSYRTYRLLVTVEDLITGKQVSRRTFFRINPR